MILAALYAIRFVVLKLFLKKNNFDIATANNGEQALKIALADNPDVVITDIQMPKMTGQELCENLIKNCPNPDRLLIVMTSRTDHELRNWAKSFEHMQFLEKPLSPRRLVAFLRDYFSNETETKELPI